MLNIIYGDAKKSIYNTSSGNLQVNPNVKDIVSVSEIYCQNCLVKNICAGTYYSAFDIYGERLIVPYQ